MACREDPRERVEFDDGCRDVSEQARYGWGSDFPTFRDTSPSQIRQRLQGLVHDASPEQIRAWDQAIPQLQQEVREVLDLDAAAKDYTAVLEYELPMESRRPDAVLLVRGPVIVLELKGKETPSQADLDQASAYARDLRCYHRECANRPVVPVLVPTAARGLLGERAGVRVVGPDALDELVEHLVGSASLPPIPLTRFLSADAYCPLPTLVEAARELFHNGQLRTIWRAQAATDPAVDTISRIVHEAAQAGERRLVLVTGVPGSGKTLVGLRIAHAHFLDDLSVPRKGSRPPAPAVFLSGNGPLVEVLQYQLRRAGGGGKTFVRGVMDYVRHYSLDPSRVPPQHVLIFDEAQRAFDAEQVQRKHSATPGFLGGKSEPEHFIEFADRVPGWCVVIGLIGEGQEIHEGEEAGLVQWRQAVQGSTSPQDWRVHGPPAVAAIFGGSDVVFAESQTLNLNVELRYHLAHDLHRFVDQLLTGIVAEDNASLARRLEAEGYHLRLSRDLDDAKQYLRARYADDRDARFGLVASSRDKCLEAFGIPNGFRATQRVRFGPWYGDSEDSPGKRSCRHLIDCVTEFGAQGLELDAALLAWGTDYRLDNGTWSSQSARRYRRGAHVVDPHRLRLNAYRVLLTRARDATVVFVPPLSEMDETFEYLARSGFQSI